MVSSQYYSSAHSLAYSAVFIVDSGSEVFVWIGNAASKAEKQNAMSYAHVSVLYSC